MSTANKFSLVKVVQQGYLLGDGEGAANRAHKADSQALANSECLHEPHFS